VNTKTLTSEKTQPDRDFGPYGDIVEDLVKSTMRAQLEIFQLVQAGKQISEIPDANINRHFAWLAILYKSGKNRHLFDGIGDNHPLKTDPLRALSQLKEDLNLKSTLDDRKSIPLDFLKTNTEVVQAKPTRISRLIKLACQTTLDAEKHANETRRSKRRVAACYLHSPLSIVIDYLTVPEMPGSRAYALVPLRNQIFQKFKTSPSGLSQFVKSSFTIQELEDAFSHIWTSMRPRHWSSGKDPLPAEGRQLVDGVVRHFLALKGVLWLRFKVPSARLEYLRSQEFRGNRDFEFVRAEYLDRLPDIGEVTNELWGLPLPIRGADTIFRGGIRFTSGKGLVASIRGGAGAGKTTLALAFALYMAPFGIKSLFLTAEEHEADLRIRADGLVADEIRRLHFFPTASKQWLKIERYEYEDGNDILGSLEDSLEKLAKNLEVEPAPQADENYAVKPCRAIVIVDGLHDLIMLGSNGFDDDRHIARLRGFINRCRELKALVILTSAEHWSGDNSLDYFVDLSIRVSQNDTDAQERKADRRLQILKSRYQLCAIGTHGIQIAGTKGVRFSPQINYQLDRGAIWKTRLPNQSIRKNALRRVMNFNDGLEFAATGTGTPSSGLFHQSSASVSLPIGANIFINGKSSGGKAALALKIATGPSFDAAWKFVETGREKILVVSFLYPEDYYLNIIDSLTELRTEEFDRAPIELEPFCKTIQLYPGDLKPNDLFNRIEWELDAAKLHGEPFKWVIIDGLHNVYLQFPEIEKYRLFWPQLFSALRSRDISVITTHTTFVLQEDPDELAYRLDDQRSEPLRHALVQKTDFQFEVSPFTRTPLFKQLDQHKSLKDLAGRNFANIFSVRTLSAIGQPIPQQSLLWSRDKLVLFELPEELRNKTGLVE